MNRLNQRPISAQHNHTFRIRPDLRRVCMQILLPMILIERTDFTGSSVLQQEAPDAARTWICLIFGIVRDYKKMLHLSSNS